MKYIIKRVVIAILSFLAIMLIKQNVFAISYSENIGSVNQQIGMAQTNYQYSIQPAIFSGFGEGVFIFNFSLAKAVGSATDPHVTARSALIYAGSTPYICDIGSFENTNSTYTQNVYTATCPVYLGTGQAITQILINFNANANFTTQYSLLRITGVVTFSKSDVNLISAQLETINGNITTGNNASANVSANIQNQTTAITQAQQQTTTAINNASTTINNTLTNDSTTEAQTTGGGFFNNFQEDSHGLSGIVTAPLRLINSFTTQTCQPLEFDLPFVHNHVALPCMKPIYQNHFGVFFTFYQMLTSGVLCYMVLINILAKVKQLQNPFNDRIAVLNL